jgi:hypothetical protein
VLEHHARERHRVLFDLARLWKIDGIGVTHRGFRAGKMFAQILG